MSLRIPCPVGAAAVVALLLLVSSACGSGGDASATGSGSQTLAESGSGEIYDAIVGTLDRSYDELDRPSIDFDNLERVKDHAFERLSGRMGDWPSGTSFSLSVLSDRVAIYVNCDGTEKKGDWAPDA